MAALQFVAFDIETTGLDATETVTTVGFALELGCRVFLQTEGRSADGVEAAVRERTDRHVVLSCHDDESALVTAMGAFVGERFRDEEVLLVGYNAETWQSGFDLPFLRSRYAACDVAWPFIDVPYADLFPVVTNRFNTRRDGESQSDLGGVYGMLCEGALNDRDPFADSVEAVRAFEAGRFADLVTHNVVDVARTAQVGAVAKRYCSKSDFQLKSLTPTTHAEGRQ